MKVHQSGNLSNAALDAIVRRQDEVRTHAVVLTSAVDIPVAPVRWLWRNYLACGKLHILGGAPSTGKTTIALDLAATVSKGADFPDGTRSNGGRVVIWSGEDDPADTLVPRLMAAGADLTKVHFIEGVRESGRSRSFDPARDVPLLEAALSRWDDVSLVVVDSIVSAIAGDGHKNSDVRRGLQPLVDMIARHDIAAIGITHFSKGTSGRDPVERITGSLAFGALARVVMIAAKEEPKADDPDDTPTDRRIFSRAKSNLGPDGGGFGYRIEPVTIAGEIETTWIVWGEPLQGTAKEILARAESVDDGENGVSAVDEACRFLTVELEDGPVAVKELERRANDAGISKSSLKRGCARIGATKRKIGFGEGARWTVMLRKKTPEGDQE